MTPAEEQQLAHAAKTNAAVRKLLDERARLRAALIELCDVTERLYTNGAMPGYHELTERAVAEKRKLAAP